jgi:hypothetical protein
MNTKTLSRLQESPATSTPTLAHIVAPKDGKEGSVLAMEARLNGTEVKALCGHILVPSRDPRAVPPCMQCCEIFEGKFGPEGRPSDA